MTTFVDFSPSQTAPFQFQAALDNQIYTVTILWGLFGARYYCQISTLQGQLIILLPLIGSPPDYNISLTAGYFTTPLIYRAGTNQFEIG